MVGGVAAGRPGIRSRKLRFRILASKHEVYVCMGWGWGDWKERQTVKSQSLPPMTNVQQQ